MPKKTISSEALIEPFEHSPYGITTNMQAIAIKSALGIGVAYIYNNQMLIRQLDNNIRNFFIGIQDFANNRKKEWDRYYEEMDKSSIDKTTRRKKAEDTMLQDLKIHCAFSKASETTHTVHSQNSRLMAATWRDSDHEHWIQSHGFGVPELGHPFSVCDNTDLNYLLEDKNVIGLPYVFSQLSPNSNMWITYRTIEYLLDKTNQENKLGKFNMYFWSYAELVKRLQLDLQDMSQDDNILPDKYLSMIKKTFDDRDSSILKQIKIMNRFNSKYANDDDIEEKIRNISEREFTEIFKMNKNVLQIMSLQVSNDELAITAFLQILDTGPVFNSLLLAKYVPSVLGEEKNVIYSLRSIYDQTENWFEFTDTVRADYETTLYTLAGGTVATILGVCAFNALGLGALSTVLTAGGCMGLAWKKEAEKHKLLKVALLGIGWHAPSIAYITYQILVVKNILTTLRTAISYTQQSKLRYGKMHKERLDKFEKLNFLIRNKQNNIQQLTQSVDHNTRLSYVTNSTDDFRAANREELEKMWKELEVESENHRALGIEIERYKIGQSANNAQNSGLLTTYASLMRNIDELTLCQKCVGTLSVVSILNDVACTLLHRIEKFDGEWNFMAHQIGMLYSHIGSENKRPIEATYLLTPFDSVFHAVARCVNEQFVNFFCSNNAHSQYISEIYLNISSTTLAFGYFLRGPLSSLLEIIRFLISRMHMYYSNDKMDEISTTLKDHLDEFKLAQAITRTKDEKYLALSNIQMQQEFYQRYGRITSNEIHPEFTPHPTLMINSSAESQLEYDRLHKKFNSLLSIEDE